MRDDELDVSVRLVYQGVEKRFIISNTGFEAIAALRSDLRRLKIPHPKTENVEILFPGCIQFGWRTQRGSTLHRQLVQRARPSDREVIDELHIATITLQERVVPQSPTARGASSPKRLRSRHRPTVYENAADVHRSPPHDANGAVDKSSQMEEEAQKLLDSVMSDHTGVAPVFAPIQPGPSSSSSTAPPPSTPPTSAPRALPTPRPTPRSSISSPTVTPSPSTTLPPKPSPAWRAHPPFKPFTPPAKAGRVMLSVSSPTRPPPPQPPTTNLNHPPPPSPPKPSAAPAPLPTNGAHSGAPPTAPPAPPPTAPASPPSPRAIRPLPRPKMPHIAIANLHDPSVGLLAQELRDTRRKIADAVARESRILEALRGFSAVAAPPAAAPLQERAPPGTGAGAGADAKLRLEALEKELAGERRRRAEAERVVRDVRRECRAPFVVPALLDAFAAMSRLSGEALAEQ